MKKKSLFLILTLSLVFNTSQAVILTEDIGVKAKDIQKVADTISAMKTVYDQMSSLKGNISDLSKVNSAMNTIMNNKFVKEFCYGCSEETIEDLEKYKIAEAKNWCDTVNQHVNFINGSVSNITQLNSFIENLPNIIKSGDPSSLAAVFNMATSKTVDQLNRTQSQAMSYQMAKERNQEIDSKLSQMKANKALFGTTCPECINLKVPKN